MMVLRDHYDPYFDEHFNKSSQVVAVYLQDLSYEAIAMLSQSFLSWVNEYKAAFEDDSPYLYYIEDHPWELSNPDSTSSAYDTIPSIFAAMRQRDPYVLESDLPALLSAFKTFVKEKCTEIDASIYIPEEYLPADCTGNWFQRMVCEIVQALLRIFKPIWVLVDSEYIPDLNKLDRIVPTIQISDRGIPV